MTRIVATLVRADRRAGAALRGATAARPVAARLAAAAAAALSPGTRLAVAVLILGRATRPAGLRGLAAGVAAALAARALRDRIGRRRPGGRAEGGFPSRHSAAAVAVTLAVAPGAPRAGAALAAATALALPARVATGDHDPADILAGAALGAAVGGVLRGLPLPGAAAVRSAP
ncbi:MAG TPA: phosphatase PAP2 family protein [Miltoncostaeaceae bacterium]|nr:phosphatase PAP2 family protein [Miltoncostaeaceae bacterium]